MLYLWASLKNTVMNKTERITKEMSESGLPKYISMGLKKEIACLTKIIKDNESITNSVMGYLAKRKNQFVSEWIPGILFLTSDRILYLGRKEKRGKIDVSELQYLDITSIKTEVKIHKGVRERSIIFEADKEKMYVKDALHSNALQIMATIVEGKIRMEYEKELLESHTTRSVLNNGNR